MIIKQQQLKGIRDGSVSLAFRNWTRPSVKKGTLMKTAIGQVEIIDIDVVAMDDITDHDAKSSGFDNRDALLRSLRHNDEGQLYRIRLRYHGEDPRIALRNKTDLGDDAFAQLEKKLRRLDVASNQGPWTKETLEAIRDHPRVVSTALAKVLNRERMWLKLNIRKLKNLGLTISHEVGYEISPLGLEVLKRMLKGKVDTDTDSAQVAGRLRKVH